MKIMWLNGDSTDCFVLEMFFADGNFGYLKNKSYAEICSRYESFWNDPNILGLTLYNTEGNVVATKYRAAG